ncbi:MerR family transcriptional regulator [bacterium]|nr:MerR family transcriptional regulator [bacterium]
MPVTEVSVPIPRKIYYSITEVAEMADVKPHVLRYWETEFSVLRPKKNRAGNRTYQEKDVKLVLQIRKLLYEEGFTIKGARKRLQDKKSAAQRDQIEIPFTPAEQNGQITEIRRELESLLADLR